MAGGVTISFQELTFTVQPKTGAPSLTILKGVSGEVLPGRVLAIMGASGAGKTTLLDVLAGHTYTGAIGGTVLVDGQPRKQKQFVRMSSYVQQRDVLMASATVREALLTVALLKLPRSLARAEKEGRVDAILEELDLVGCQHTLIGDELLNIKGISGGQRRRVSVGIELVKQPRVLFLDEPTSGLDSEMAVSLMDMLLRLARAGRTICVTIHQPNSAITRKFDDFMLLTGGRVAYFGVWEEAVSLFTTSGYPCPNYSNPTDHFLSVLHDPEAAEAVVAAYAALPAPPGHSARGGLKGGSVGAMPLDAEAGEGLADGAWGAGADGSSKGGKGSGAVGRQHVVLALETDAEEEGKGSRSKAGTAGSIVAEAPKAPFHYQMYVLAVRMWRNWFRSPMMLVAEAMQYTFLALFVGLVYLRLTDSVDTGVSDRLASFWFALASLSFTPSYTAAVAWDSERVLLRRETGQGMYSPTAFFAAKTITVLPFQVAQTTLFCVIAYFMVGYYASAGQLFIYLAVMNLFQITSETLGLITALITSRSMYAVILLTFILIFLMSFTGFLVSAVPVYFVWIPKISYLSYAYSALVGNEFNHATFYSADGTSIPGTEVVPSTVQNGLSVGANICVVLGLCVGTRLLAFAIMSVMARLKRI